MSIQIIGTKKCRETQKTERYFRERNIPYHLVDLNQRALSPGELQSIAASIPPEELIDTESKLYKKKGMAYMEFDIMEELLENSGLIKTPIVRFGKKAVLGFDPEQWHKLMGED